MKNTNITLSIFLLLVTSLLQMQNAVSQISIERLKLPATSDSITRILEDEVTGRVIRIFTKFDKTHLTKHTYVKGMPSVQSGFILENGQRIELPLNEHVECIRNNFIITSNGDVFEYKTVFTLCKLEVSNSKLNLKVIDTLISNGDYSMAVFLNNDRIMIMEVQEGGVETLTQIYDLQLNLLSNIKPYANCNVTGSSYAVGDDLLYYSVEPDQFDEAGLSLPKIMIINTSTGHVTKEKHIENLKHGLQISNCENMLIGYYFDNIFGYDLDLNLLWNRKGLVPSEYTFVKGDQLLMILYSIDRSNDKISGLDIKNGNIVWQKSINDFLKSKTFGCASDIDYSLRIYKMQDYNGTNTIALIAGGYLKTDRHTTFSQMPLFIKSKIVIMDSRGVLISEYPVDFNEVTPILLSKKSFEKNIAFYSVRESIKLKINENK